MRLIARTEFTYAGKDLRPGDIFNATAQDAIDLTNRDLAHRFHLEDPATLTQQENPPEQPPEPLPDVPPVTLNPTSASYTSAGGSGTFDVTVTGPGISGTWIIDKDADAIWLNVISPTTPQTVSGTVDYLVGGTTIARVAHFYINGKTFTVNQTAPV